MAAYRVLCADLLTLTVREELAVEDLKYGWALNAPGSFSGWVSLDDAKATRANLNPGATAILIERGGLLVWGGILWTASADTISRKLTLGGEGFWSYFRRRLIRTTTVYTGADQLFVARDLINYAQAQPGSFTKVTVGSETSGATVNKTFYQYERKNLGQAIEELAAALNGFDFSIEPSWDSIGTTVQLALKLYYPRRGTRIDGLVFNHNVQGISKFVVPVDASTMANLIDAMGQGDGDAMLIASSANTSSLGTYPLLEDTYSAKDVNDPTLLTGIAQAQVGRRRLPIELPSLEKKGDIWPDFGSFGIGDEGFVVVSDGWVAYSGFQRIQTIDVTVSQEGYETMTPGFVNADVSVN